MNLQKLKIEVARAEKQCGLAEAEAKSSLAKVRKAKSAVRRAKAKFKAIKKAAKLAKKTAKKARRRAAASQEEFREANKSAGRRTAPATANKKKKAPAKVKPPLSSAPRGGSEANKPVIDSGSNPAALESGTAPGSAGANT